MTIKLRYLLLLLCIGPWARAQVKIGDNPQNLDPASILELESTSRALVISRVTTTQMNAITPLRGAMVYNTDADCLYYYDGTNWINLCEASGGPFTFTTDPVVNPISTIAITKTGNNYNFEVGEITSNNIVDGSINGFSDIQDGTISSSKLQDRAVGPSKLEEGAVSSFEIEDQSILTLDIAPEGPNQVLSTDSNGTVQWQDKGSLTAITDQTTITGAGTASDRLKVSDALTTAIANNTTDITGHIAADGDTDSTNELQTLAIAGNKLSISDGNTITIPTSSGSDTQLQEGMNIGIAGAGIAGDPYVISNTYSDGDNLATNELITGASLNGTTLTITEAGVDHDVVLNGLGGGGGSQDLASVLAIDNDANALLIKNLADPVDAQDAATKAYVDANIGGGGGGGQNLASVLGVGNDAGGGKITGLAIPTLDSDAATKKYVDDAVIAGGGGIPTDELQDIQLGGTILSLTTPATPGDNLDLDLTFATDLELAAIDINDADANPINEIQALSILGNDLSLSNGGGTVTLPSGAADGVVSNIATLGTELTITGTNGGFDGNIDLEPLVDAAAGNNGYLSAEVDGSITNEIELPPGGNSGQVLSTNGIGVYNWVDLPNFTIPTILTGSILFSDGAGGLTSIPDLSWNAGALEVPGEIHATGNITSGGTFLTVPDYVFETYFKGSSELNKEYRFKTLAEIEAFVKENHHLPGILSAEEVKASGKWNLTQASVKNLEKIEELYLHTIEQQKEIEQLKADKDSLSQEVKAIKLEMEEIKKLLENKIKE